MEDAKRHVDNTKDKFGKAEEFMVEMLRADPEFDPPRFTARLNCLKFKATFNEDMTAVLRDIEIVHNASLEVLDNPRLKEFLVEVILPFGTSASAFLSSPMF